MSDQESKPTRPNFAGRLANLFTESRLTFPLAMAILLFGLIGLSFTPREENPQIIVPAAEVRVSFPGLLPDEIEHLLLTPLESVLGGIDGVKHTYGLAVEGEARVTVEFEVGEDKEDALVQLYDHVLRQRHLLPTGATEPQIISIDPDNVPLFVVTLASSVYDDYQLRRMAEQMTERLRNLEDVGQARVVGGRSREVRVNLDPKRLQVFGVTLNQIRDAIFAGNISTPLGLHVNQNSNQMIRVVGRLTNAAEVEEIIVVIHEDRPVRIRDLATVTDGPPEQRNHYTRFSYGPADPQFKTFGHVEMAAVSIAVSKRSGVNAVPLTRAIRKRVAQMQTSLLPNGVKLIVTRDDGQKADRAVSTLVGHLAIAVGIVSLILFVFLDRRSTIIVVVAIPLVFSVVMGFDLLWGPTLNRITLYALILVLGMLVDDVIVVIENIHRHFQQIPPNASIAVRTQAAVRATNEIGNPTILATITVVLVFLSLILVTGMLGQYFRPITFNVPVAMLASLVIAFTFTPWAARRWLPKTEKKLESSKPDRLQKLYRAICKPLMGSTALRRLFALGVVALMALSFIQPSWQFIRAEGVTGASPWFGVPLGFLPKDNKNTFLVHIHLPETSPLEVTDRAAREMESLLLKNPYVVNLQTSVGIPAVIDFNSQLRGSSGNIGPQFAEIRVNLVLKHLRSTTSIDLVKALRPAIREIAARYPNSNFQLIEDPPGPPVRATVLAELYGSDFEGLYGLSNKVVHAFRNTHDMAEIWGSVAFPLSEFHIRIDRDKAALSGVAVADVSRVLRTLVVGEHLSTLKISGERTAVPIVLKVPGDRRIDPEILQQVYVTNNKNNRIPLSELTKVMLESGPRPIMHKNGERVIYVGGELEASAPVYAILDLDKRLDNLALPDNTTLETGNLRLDEIRPNILDGYKLLWDGEIRLTLDAFRDMGLALGMALTMIFMLLVAYYRSFTTPLIAMASVPLAFIGVFPGHWLLNTTFSAASMVGVIALAGVVVRNALLIIDFIHDYRSQGNSLEDSALEAGAVRLRPILLTTISTALGMAVMVPDPTFGGLAISLIFGAISSALLTVFVTPLLFVWWTYNPTK
ncbi:MAG: efflux RND transporter permease subunit [SAR324 cluster bacterium]|nr:efflux RND transporter permease subunit [SAR324 cluster bacterium]